MVKLTSRPMAVVVIAAFATGIGIATAAGWWQTESAKVPATIASGEFAGEYDPADIRGSYSFGDIEQAFGVSAELLARAFGVEGLEEFYDAAAFQAKSLEELYGAQPDGGEVGTDAVRLFVSLYVGIPYEPEETTRLPLPSLRELETKLAPADLEMVRQIAVPVADLRAAGTAEVDVAEPASGGGAAGAEEHVDEEGVVRGKTTFNELLDWGLTKEQIEEVLGGPMGPRAMTMRDFVTQSGGQFSEYRERFQALLD